MLIAHGHRLVEVWTYSLRAIQVYLDLIHRRRGQALYDLTVAVRHTQGTDNKVFKEFLASLQGDDVDGR